jgi:hypothetical protein
MKLLITRWMRALAVVSMLSIFATAPAFAQQDRAKIDLSPLEKFADRADKVITVTVDDQTLRLAAAFLNDKKPDEARIKELILGLKGVFVKRYEFEKEGEYTAADVESIRSQLSLPGWSSVANVRSKREGNYDVSLMSEGTVIKGLAVLAAESRAFTVVNIVGPIDLAKLAELEGKFGIPHFGLEQIPGVTVTDKKKDKNPEPEKQLEQPTPETSKRAEKKPPTLIRGEKPPTE